MEAPARISTHGTTATGAPHMCYNRPRRSARSAPPSLDTAIWSLVRSIPPGRVMTYGQIATLLGTPRAARAVGYAMFFCKDDSVPWQRVINAKGEISLGGDVDRPLLQRELLLAEGVEFDVNGRIHLKKYMWWPQMTD